MKDIRKQPYRPAPGLVPNELIEKKFNCPDCKTEVHVPWVEKLPYPRQPFNSLIKKISFVPSGFPLCCPIKSCQKEFHVSVPILPNKNRWALYGDEAGRYIHQPNPKYSSKPLHFYCITLVGLHRKKHERLRRQIEQLKKSIAPSLNPEIWQHHFSEIWGSHPDSGKFILQNKDAKINHAKKFAKIIREARPELATFNISGCIIVSDDTKEWKQHLKTQKENLFCQAIMATLQQFRSNHKSVNWIFDNVKDTTEGTRTEGWAAECFLGLQYTRLFTWLSSGATVLEPKFVPPGSHYLLEIADFISYCVARDFEKAILGSKSEFPSSLLGKSFYQGTIGDGSVKYKWQHGLPLQDFYGINR